MQDDKSQLMTYAMQAGVFLGLFWILKYLFVIVSPHLPALSLVGSFLVFGTPLLLFYFLTKYRMRLPGQYMGYWHGVQFGILLFFFASILESVLVFVHITWIDPKYIGNLYVGLVDVAKSLNLSQTMTESIENQPLPTTINYIFSNVMMADVFIGIVLSLIIVPLSTRFNRAEVSSQPHKNRE